MDALEKIPFPLMDSGASCYARRGGMDDIFSLTPDSYPKLTPHLDDILHAKEIFADYHIPLPDAEQTSDKHILLGIFPGAQHFTKQ